MTLKEHLNQLDEYLWEIPRATREGMLVPAHVYSSEKLLQGIGADKSLEQLTNVAMIPGICKAAIVMSDAHEGYGFPIGGVAATEWPGGAISPGGLSDLQRHDLTNRGRILPKPYTHPFPPG